jgi:hypothetical protein
MSTSSRFDSFLRNIKITASDLEDAQRKVSGVAGKLHSHYNGTTYDASTRMLIGSYGKQTQVRPPRDVDILFLMPLEQYQRFDSYQGNGQSALLQSVKSILSTRYPSTDVRGDGQVVVVPFSDGHTVEVLPAWRTTDKKFRVPNTHDGGSWNDVDHNAEIANVANSDRANNGNTRNLIQMMKIWQAYCSVPIKSLVLELRAVNFMSTWEHREKGTTYYDWMVRDFLTELIKMANFTSQIPGIEEKCHYGDAWVTKAESALGRALKACQYESDNMETDATLEWRKIFGAQYVG